MSLHRPEKRLAVLESIFDKGLSVRKAAVLHGVDKNSVQSWSQEHRSGKCTLKSLREKDVVPTQPVSSKSIEEWQKQGANLLESMRTERKNLDKQINVLRASFAEQIAVLTDRDRKLVTDIEKLSSALSSK
jgi:transposase-like protein